MNKATIKKLVAKQLAVLSKSSEDVFMAKWQRGKALYEIRSMVVWKNTPYKTFSSFVKQELPDMCVNSVTGWINQYRVINSYNYTLADAQSLSTVVTYHEVVVCLTNIRRKPTIPQLIARIQKLRGKVNRKVNSKGKNINSFVFHLDDAHAAKLDLLLVNNGMTQSAQGRRINSSEAMATYLDAVLP